MENDEIITEVISKLQRFEIMCGTSWTYQSVLEECAKWVGWDTILTYAAHKLLESENVSETEETETKG